MNNQINFQLTDLEVIILNFFQKYEKDIILLSLNQFKQENLKGSSKIQYQKSIYYIYSLIYALCIYLDVQDNSEITLKDLEEKYKLSCVKKELACKKINFDDVLNIFNIIINESENGGIENIGIEDSFEVEPNEVEEEEEIIVLENDERFNEFLNSSDNKVNYVDMNISSVCSI